MKIYRIFLSALVFALILSNSASGQGSIYTKSFFSQALNKEMNYNIYLPDDYQNSEDELPLFLLLHGYTGDHTDWKKQGHVDKTINRLIMEDESFPMIIVMPDAGNSWYVDSDPEISWGHYETAIIEDLIKHIEKNYPVIKDKNSRFIAGLSMGGYGALHLAFKYPDLFKAASSMSAAYMQKVPDNYTYLEKTFGEPLNREKYQHESPFNLASSDSTRQMPVYITCGDDDLRLYHYSVDMYDTLTAKQYPVELRITDGAHTWEVWAREIKNVIRFFNQ
ncbi:MAG TPA: alpha/beta hydrolase family protein [Bacteroidales bacterium]|nr:alpha/beta hydrolase family protein [Bacteroidales bacterium]